MRIALGDRHLMRIGDGNSGLVKGLFHLLQRVATQVPPVAVRHPGAGAKIDRRGVQLDNLDPDGRLVTNTVIVGEYVPDDVDRFVDIVVVVDRQEQIEATQTTN